MGHKTGESSEHNNIYKEKKQCQCGKKTKNVVARIQVYDNDVNVHSLLHF
jgi:hypothetical protein